MYEFEIMKDTWLSLQDVHSRKPQIMCKPLLLFYGEGWELHQNLKEMFMDLFKGHDYQKIAEAGIQYCICFFYQLRPESTQISYEGDIINVRTYILNDDSEKSKQYIQTLTPEHLTPMGFQFDLKRRRQKIEFDLIQQAKKFYQPKKAENKGQKNLQKDEIGREFGKMEDLHLRHAKLNKQIQKEQQQDDEYYEEYYEEYAE